MLPRTDYALRPPPAQSSHFSEHLDEYLTEGTRKTATPMRSVGSIGMRRIMAVVVVGLVSVAGCTKTVYVATTDAPVVTDAPVELRSGFTVNGYTIRPGADLGGAYMPNANLSFADLSGANLSLSDLSGANLTGANLSGAYLGGAILTGTILHGADLTNANLQGANLSNAELTNANLQGANLTDANLTVEDLTGATMPDGWQDIVAIL